MPIDSETTNVTLKALSDRLTEALDVEPYFAQQSALSLQAAGLLGKVDGDDDVSVTEIQAVKLLLGTAWSRCITVATECR